MDALQIGEWGLTGLLAGSFLAATILPFSSEVLLLLFLKWGYDPITCLTVATIGNALGGMTNLLIGRLGRNVIRKEPWGTHLIVRYGGWLAGLSWVPFIGDPLLIALGYYRTPWLLTILCMIAGKLIRYGVLILIYNAI